MDNAKLSQKLLKGFFLLFAFSLLIQIGLLLHNRAKTAFDFILDDFKVLVTLEREYLEEDKVFANKLITINGVMQVNLIEDKEIIEALNKDSGLTSLNTFLPEGSFLPAFYELKVSKEVLRNPTLWAQENISKIEEDAQFYFKKQEASFAVYLSGVIQIIEILFIAICFAVFAFGFFVEATPTKILPLSERFAFILVSFLAYALSFGALIGLTYYLHLIPFAPYNPFNLYELLGLLIALLLGWSCAKWAKL